jgi:hypothetical protein
LTRPEHPFCRSNRSLLIGCVKIANEDIEGVHCTLKWIRVISDEHADWDGEQVWGVEDGIERGIASNGLNEVYASDSFRVVIESGGKIAAET